MSSKVLRVSHEDDENQETYIYSGQIIVALRKGKGNKAVFWRIFSELKVIGYQGLVLVTLNK